MPSLIDNRSIGLKVFISKIIWRTLIRSFRNFGPDRIFFLVWMYHLWLTNFGVSMVWYNEHLFEFSSYTNPTQSSESWHNSWHLTALLELVGLDRFVWFIAIFYSGIKATNVSPEHISVNFQVVIAIGDHLFICRQKILQPSIIISGIQIDDFSDRFSCVSGIFDQTLVTVCLLQIRLVFIPQIIIEIGKAFLYFLTFLRK